MSDDLVKTKYTHIACGYTSSLRTGTARLMASSPNLYNCLRCHNCKDHFPVGRYGDFIWEGTDLKVGE
jgi:hypothetical protein